MATKSETYDVNRFLRLIKAHKTSALTINMLVDSIQAQQKGRAKLGKLRTELCAETKEYNQSLSQYEEVKELITKHAVAYFQELPITDFKGRRETVVSLRKLSSSAKFLEANIATYFDSMAAINNKIDAIIAEYGDCDTSLELAINEYYNAVNGYNEIAEKLSKFKGVNIPLHDAQEITKVKTFEINPHFGEEDNSEVLI